MTNRVETIRQALEKALSPSQLDIEDQSHLHVGHAGARDGRGHFHITVAAAAFVDQSLMSRHRMVYAALGQLMETDIHALSITATEPN